MGSIRIVVLLASLASMTGTAMACTANAERIRNAVQSDIRTRNVAASVGERLLGELAQAVDHCRAGRNAQGEAILTRIRNTYSYR